MARDIETDRAAFLRDVARVPLTQVQGYLDSVSFLSPNERAQIERRRDELLTERQAKVLRTLEADFESLRGRMERAQEDADSIVREMEELVEKAESGQVALDEFLPRFNDLDRRLANVRRNIASATAAVEAIRLKEEDPEAWLQSLERKYPAIKEGVLGSLMTEP